MKYLLRALCSELIGFITLAIVISTIGGILYVINYYAGDNTIGVLLILAFVILQACITIDHAVHLKRMDNSKLEDA